MFAIKNENNTLDIETIANDNETISEDTFKVEDFNNETLTANENPIANFDDNRENINDFNNNNVSTFENTPIESNETIIQNNTTRSWGENIKIKLSEFFTRTKEVYGYKKSNPIVNPYTNDNTLSNNNVKDIKNNDLEDFKNDINAQKNLNDLDSLNKNSNDFGNVDLERNTFENNQVINDIPARPFTERLKNRLSEFFTRTKEVFGYKKSSSITNPNNIDKTFDCNNIEDFTNNDLNEFTNDFDNGLGNKNNADFNVIIDNDSDITDATAINSTPTHSSSNRFKDKFVEFLIYGFTKPNKTITVENEFNEEDVLNDNEEKAKEEVLNADCVTNHNVKTKSPIYVEKESIKPAENATALNEEILNENQTTNEVDEIQAKAKSKSYFDRIKDFFNNLKTNNATTNVEENKCETATETKVVLKEVEYDENEDYRKYGKKQFDFSDAENAIERGKFKTKITEQDMEDFFNR